MDTEGHLVAGDSEEDDIGLQLMDRYIKWKDQGVEDEDFQISEEVKAFEEQQRMKNGDYFDRDFTQEELKDMGVEVADFDYVEGSEGYILCVFGKRESF